MPRDDFSSAVKDGLAKRVNMRCSNPTCEKPTSGPHSDPIRALNIGVAAHITAAAPGGPRYDATLTGAERSSAENGVWLCQSCGKLVDNDANRFNTALLRIWKAQAELKALSGVGGAAHDALPQPVSARHAPLPRIRWMPYSLARQQLIDNGWHPSLRHWSDSQSPELQFGNGQHYWGMGFREIAESLGIGASACVFAFTDAYGHSLDVFTEGEVDPDADQEAMVTSWRIREASPTPEGLLTEDAPSQAIAAVRLPTPTNVMDSVGLGTPSEKVKQRLGIADVIAGDRWQYRFVDTQVEIAFAEDMSVKSLVIALVQGNAYRGIDAPFGDFVLGDLTVQDLMDMHHISILRRDSMRTDELIVPVRVGPAGAWSECFFGALLVYSGVGHLAETEFEWDNDAEQLRSPPSTVVFNWVGVGGSLTDPPYFDWYIKG